MSRFSWKFVATWLLLAWCPARADTNDWAEGHAGPDDGATRQYYNGAARLPWVHPMGDWRDREGVEQGNADYARATVNDDDQGKWITWDVTRLVGEWFRGEVPNRGFFLRHLGEEGKIHFASREWADAARRPELWIRQGDVEHRLTPVADTYLTPSTYRSQGTAEKLRVTSTPESSLLRFDLAELADQGNPTEATLRLFSTHQYGTSTIGVFRCAQDDADEHHEIQRGLAANYPGDVGIVDHEQVLFHENFEDRSWGDHWTSVAVQGALDRVGEGAEFGFKPLSGAALRIKIAAGTHGALNTLWKYARQSGQEPEEAYFRYYLRLGNDWNQTIQGGKLPGFSGTYGRTGWGGRRSRGRLGWSARGLFLPTIPAHNPLAGRTPIGTYAYHAEMKGDYGSNWLWQIGNRGYLETDRWYAIEQYVRLNSPSRADGVMRAWVDGRLAFEKTDIRFRVVDELKVEQVWMNVYHGGKKPSPFDQHLFIDNVVIAKSYIGPLADADRE